MNRWLLGGIALFTAVETAALAGWLALTDTMAVLSVVILLVGLFVEGLINAKVVAGDFFPNPGSQALVAVTETVFWVVWLAIWMSSPVVATVFLFGTMAVQHAAEDSLARGRPLLGNLLNADVLPHTAVEVVAATVWLVLVQVGLGIPALVVLFAGLLVEHRIAVALVIGK